MISVLIRVDASHQIGSGHVMRCLTIAEQLRIRNCSVSFFMKELPGNMVTFVENLGFNVVSKFFPVDICIIDHYEIDIKWELGIRKFVKKIIVIDDLANRRHDCDILLDQNIVDRHESRYDGLVPDDCVKLLGSRYLIFREEFIRARKSAIIRSAELKKILVFMGGTDPTGETMKILQALSEVGHIFQEVNIVVGSSNRLRREIKEACDKEGYHYHEQINYLAKLMLESDFMLGAGGITMWERAFLGLPSTSTIVADNQIASTEKAESLGIVWNLGWHEDVTVQSYMGVIGRLITERGTLRKMSEIGMNITKYAKRNNWIDLFLEGL